MTYNHEHLPAFGYEDVTIIIFQACFESFVLFWLSLVDLVCVFFCLLACIFHELSWICIDPSIFTLSSLDQKWALVWDNQ